jgi:hypothetical protein
MWSATSTRVTCAVFLLTDPRFPANLESLWQQAGFS